MGIEARDAHKYRPNRERPKCRADSLPKACAATLAKAASCARMRPRLVLARGRKRMKKETINGATLAIAAVSIALAGTAPAAKAETTAARVHCLGVNSCKGKSDCHTPKNACKGMNS